MAPSMSEDAYADVAERKAEMEKQVEARLWQVRDIPGKGKGLVATQNILPGTLLLSEAPALTTESVTSFEPDATENQLSSALSKLPMATQKALRSLHNNHSEDDANHPLSGIVRSNAYSLGAGADVGGVFLDIARINHSCAPNCVQYWNPLLEKFVIHAVKEIGAGEEITTSYHEGGPSEERLKTMKDHFGFDCSCSLCSLPADQLAASDERFKRARELDAIIGDAGKMYHTPDEVMKCCREMYEIFEKENVKDGRLSRLYYDLFQMCNMHGDLARARCFAKYYSDTTKLAEGIESINVLEVKPFIKNPEKHGSWGSTEKWMTATADVPRKMSANDFAKWLWRE